MMSATIDINKFTVRAQTNPNFGALIQEMNKSQTLVDMINKLPNSSAGIIDFAPNVGTSSQAGTSGVVSSINIDPALFSLYPSTPDGLGVIATAIGHELGHSELQYGFPTLTGVTDPVTAAGIGARAEGVAVVIEYQVAKGLGVAMYSDTVRPNPQTTLTIQSQLEAINNGASPDGLYNAEVGVAEAAYSSLHPSVAPQTTCTDYYRDAWAFQKWSVRGEVQLQPAVAVYVSTFCRVAGRCRIARYGPCGDRAAMQTTVCK